MKANSQRVFRTTLNTMMIISIVQTLSYIFVGESQYRHEIWGSIALVLVLYHCMMNKWWYKRVIKNTQDLKKKLPTRSTYYINMLLTAATLMLGISSIMISKFAFGFLGISYQLLWHYIHLISGGAFILLMIMHALLHIPSIRIVLKE